MPFGLFKSQVLPQEVKPAMDISQGQMPFLFSHLRGSAPKIYLEYAFHINGNDFDDHMKKLNAILMIPKKAGMQVSAKKSTWCTTALEFLILGSLQRDTNH